MKVVNKSQVNAVYDCIKTHLFIDGQEVQKIAQ